MGRRTVLVCDLCGSDGDVFQFHLRAVGSTAPEFRGELCRGCYMETASKLGGRRGKPRRGLRQDMTVVDYDTGKPL